MKRLLPLFLLPFATVEAETDIWFIAGPKSHPPGCHEHPAGCELLAREIAASGLNVKTHVSHGWPTNPEAIHAASWVIYGDGLQFHPAITHEASLRQRHERGLGLAVLHWAVEPPEGELTRITEDAIGGRFEAGFSVNPVWRLSNPTLANHEITRGISPFSIREEWYFHLRLRSDVTHLLTALPPESTLGPDGPRSGNPTARTALAEGRPQTLAWCVENSTRSRGFGFTGGHFHQSWSQPDYRKLVLQGILWTARVPIPEYGIALTALPIHPDIDTAITTNDVEDVRRHLAQNPTSANQSGKPDGRPPLEQAILRNRPEIVSILLEAGAQANPTPTPPRPPLLLALDRRNPDVVAALLKAGANPNFQDRDGWSPLHHAAAKNLTEIARQLLESGAKPSLLSQLGGTPLHEAAASAGPDMIALLLDHQIDPNLRSQQGVTALDLARQFNNPAAIKLLEPVTRPVP